MRLHERDRVGGESTPVDSLLPLESEGTMSILKDRIRPLDPSSLQRFLAPEGDAEAEAESPEPLATPRSAPLGKTSFEPASRGG